MTKEELAEKLNISVNYLVNQWYKVQERQKNAGIDIIKIGWGGNATYGWKNTDETEYHY